MNSNCAPRKSQFAKHGQGQPQGSMCVATKSPTVRPARHPGGPITVCLRLCRPVRTVSPLATTATRPIRTPSRRHRFPPSTPQVEWSERR